MDAIRLFHAIVAAGERKPGEERGAGRPAGSPAEARARAICVEQLVERNYIVTERPFDFSAWPGRWATPVAGGLLGVGALLAWIGIRIHLFGQSPNVWLTIGSVFLTVAVVGGALALDFGTRYVQRDRRQSVNIEAVPRSATEAPRVWLVAHLDSKSQTIPILLRIASIMMCAAAWSVVLTLWMSAFLIHIAPTVFTPWLLVAAITALPVSMTFVGNASWGALDNASGVATVLEAAARIDNRAPVGILLTSGEELGLAGARAWVEARAARGDPPATVINVDSVDEIGHIQCMVSHDPNDIFHDVIADVAARSSESRTTIRRVIPGILVDAVAFKDAGWPAITVCRGGLRSLARVHTKRDTVARMSGEGIVPTATFVTELVGAIIAMRVE